MAKMGKNFSLLYKLELVLILIVGFQSLNILAENGAERPKFSSLYTEVNYGFTAHTSKIAETTNLGSALLVNIGVNGSHGEHTIGSELRYNSTSTSFEYSSNDTNKGKVTKIDSWFRDIVFKYKYGVVYGGPTVSTLGITNTLYGAENVDTLATGYGFNFGTSIKVGTSNFITLDALISSSSIAKDSIQTIANPVSITSRMDLSANSNVPVIDNFMHIFISLNYRTYTLAVGSKSYDESQIMTLFGLNFILL